MSLHPARYKGITTIDALRNVVTALAPGQLGYDDVRADNNLRAAWAGLALLAFKDKTMPGGDEDFDTVMGDLVADLMHLCDALGLDWGAMCDRGRSHYLPELAGVL